MAGASGVHPEHQSQKQDYHDDEEHGVDAYGSGAALWARPIIRKGLLLLSFHPHRQPFGFVLGGKGSGDGVLVLDGLLLQIKTFMSEFLLTC